MKNGTEWDGAEWADGDEEAFRDGGKAEPAQLYQFTEETMERLRRGEEFAVYGEVAAAIYDQIEGFARRVEYYTRWTVPVALCEEWVRNFVTDKIPRLISRYRDQSAKRFTAAFYRALKNYSIDRLRSLIREGRIFVPADAPVRGENGEGGGMTVGDILLVNWDTALSRLLEDERRECLARVIRAISLYAKDPVKRWVLKAGLVHGWTAREISEHLAEKIRKEYAVEAVWSLEWRFLRSAEVARIKEDYGI